MSRHVAKRTRNSQRGLALVWFMLSLTALLGMAAFTFDVSVWMHQKALAKRAADAAALAAAWCESGNACTWGGSTITAQQMADNYAQVNGATNNVTLTFPYDGQSNWVNVVVRVPMSTVFAGIFGITGKGKYIEETSTADFSGAGFFKGTSGLGVSSAYNYSVFGPNALHSNGDEWSTKYLDSGAVNPNYKNNGQYGYYFNLNISPNYQTTYGNKFQVELFDPSCYVSSSGQQVDEIRDPVSAGSGESTNITTTWFTIQYLNPSTNGSWLTATATNGNPAQVSFSGESWPHLQWVDNPNMQIDLSNTTLYPTGTSFRVNVTSTDPSVADPSDTQLNGASENGYNLRVGPPEPASDLQAASDGVNSIVTMGQNTSTTAGQSAEEAAWSTAYSTTNGIVTEAPGKMELNINNANNGSNTETAVPLDFGNVPADALGGTFTVTRFDTDVGAEALSYYDAGSTPSNLKIANGGILNSDSNDATYQDTFTVNTAGEITASYTGGTSDTSDWSISYSGFPGRIALVGQSGLSY